MTSMGRICGRERVLKALVRRVDPETGPIRAVRGVIATPGLLGLGGRAGLLNWSGGDTVAKRLAQTFDRAPQRLGDAHLDAEGVGVASRDPGVAL